MGGFFGRKTGVAAVVVLLAVSVNHYRSSKTLSPKLKIPNGEMQGVESFTRGGKKIYEYLKIPFAKPPVADLRFEPPQPAEPWVGELDATTTGPVCLQLNLISGGVEGKEDCLNLNVYTPASRKGLLPVMVWFHGGAFQFGSANRYFPAYLLDEEVILVTVPYRLAALGFLNYGSIRGNMGLKDQTMALKWVKENIEYFGGDPKHVTIFGESAGSGSVGFQLLSKMSSGLFTHAIMQSGTPLGNWAIFREPAKQAKRFAAKFNCSVTDTEEMIDCLKKVDGYDLVSAHKEILVALREKITLFVPTIETVQDKNTFIGEEPLESLMSGRVNKVPLIMGVNEEEGLLSSSIITANQTKLRQANDDWYLFAPRVFGYDDGNRKVSEKIRNYYFPDVKDIASIKYISAYTNIYSDRQFFVPGHFFAKYYMKYAPVRLYLYSYSAEFSLADILAATQNERVPVMVSVFWEVFKRYVARKVFHYEIPHLGVCHGDELQLLFNWPLSSYITDTHKDYAMSKKMVKLWADFAKDRKTLDLDNVEWPTIESKPSEPFKYLEINSNPKVINEPFLNRIKFWEDLGMI